MKKILIIEDDQDISEIITMALAGKCVVKAGTDSLELLKILDTFQPDLILIDYYIGQKEAPEIMEEIWSHQKGSRLPFILFSGHHDIGRLADNMGAIAWLAKPFNLADLYSCIGKVLPRQA